MVFIQREHKVSSSEVIERAVPFFGPEGLGMEPSQRTEHSVYFRGGRGGHVRIQVAPTQGRTLVKAWSRWWDSPVREFLEKLAEGNSLNRARDS